MVLSDSTIEGDRSDDSMRSMSVIDTDEQGTDLGSADEGSMDEQQEPESIRSRARMLAATAHYQALTATQPAACTLIPLAPRRNRNKDALWMQKAVVATRQLYQWFEAQQNDYTSHDFSICDFVDMVWTGHGGDSPRDVSARSFRVEFSSTVHKKDQATLVGTGGAVYRHYFECQGLCSTSADIEDEHSENEDGERVEEGDTAYDDARTKRGAKKAEKKRASSTKALRYSRRLRLHIMEQGSQSGVTAAQLKKLLLNGLDKLADTGATPRAFARPSWRMPTPQQVDRLVAGLKQATRLHADPFVAVDRFVEVNPDSIFAYHPLKITKTSKRFTVGVKSTWSIQNLIRWDGRAVFMDSSWRNKNENRAPLTFVTTTNAAGHMVPCVAYLSTDTTSRSFQHLLRALEDEVVAEAARICSDADRTPQAKLDTATVLLANARRICEERSWRPSTVMIDKCRAELNAINEVWPDTQVRLCQFHIMQAICRWDAEGKSATAKPPSVPRSLKPAICIAFREAQRCRDMKDWPTTLVKFEAAIKEILSKESAATVKQVLTYFAVNWWSPPWHELATDIGLQSGQTRDGMNTNNTIERAFKTFDEVFLACKVNKRIDRLVQILACDWLVYYEHYSNDEPRLSAVDRNVMLDAHRLWETGNVIRASSTSYRVLGLHANGDEPKYYVLNLAASRLKCSCTRWQQTGKLCAHMHAAKMHSASLLQQHQILAPINLGGSHWATVIINVVTKTIQCIDSMPSEARRVKVESFFRRFMSQRAVFELDRGHQVVAQADSADAWTFRSDTDEGTIYPRQDDGYSCGIVTCMVMEAAFKGKDPTWKNCALSSQFISEEEANQMRLRLHTLLQSYYASSSQHQ
ncbi:unnamed protein product [Tilletia controversa]|nr:unnamed protein product [Tilletia controversa]